ncbi:MAG: hypothetical protein COZ06_37040 [Armatimonadetes bacterium CG_4_10_14_3_um_filter_66_18]|nr:hypothetical protein [Armatimonadota bacterium]OIP05822.1 MAG: hypothetical protein AUJ96_10080 [Armatimonadetes bacterium CG2_30_66_41]PIU93347.1 MAG: hypothetical protein COS65_13280 [Armatimonadetes bacterium CG06_land_8_20_14_3_00_66_21]PIX40378.1 MAG: hypothetical protein COZ57_26130 [Armatimonadetes bacterium CG_4_8_14_3_um_filter_66_20]PIY36053.1 MAG: hypothetical protein COZ06_37040 [Armatimonadetes bacterium CG_4_10_14_3_um_filter_66_18]PIZ44508.1 MAG: hypothetical protein COY42_13
MRVTRQVIVDRLSTYLHGEAELDELVDWAEDALVEGEFEESEVETLAGVVARLGVADMRAFGLTWQDCQQMLRRLGYAARVELAPA